MGIVDFILNLAGLLLWLNWRAEKADPVGKRRPATLIGTLRRADSNSRRWQIPAVIAGLILFRALLYWQIGSAANWWSAKLDLGVTELFFRSTYFWQMFFFSVFSFIETLWIFHLWLLLLSLLNGPPPFNNFVRTQLGALDRLGRRTKILLPFIATAVLWWVASWLLAWLAVIPNQISALHRLEESLVMGLAAYLAWKVVAVLLLVLYLLNSYIYFGKQPFWNYVNAEAQTLLSPLKSIPLRAGRADFAPVVGIVLVLLLAGMAERLLFFLHGRAAM
ncbi:MAG TPA: hypothetical protein VGI03_00070 [Verrucomicrobiae bacterium]|jgi:uncharacterized protein YggT (Ycf19 family)